MKLVEAFSPSFWDGANVSPPVSFHQPKRALFARTDSDALSNEILQRHVVTVPPFLPSDHKHHGNYPSPLHKIHVIPLLTDDETSELLRLARSHATENQSWNQQDSTRHVSYPTVDFAIEESIEISQYLGQSGIKFEERIFEELSDAYGVEAGDMSFLDVFCASYESKETEDVPAQSDRNTMDQLDFHRDGSLLSFTILLSPRDEFDGGGTSFDALADVRDDRNNTIIQPSGVIQPPRAGYATLHSGKLLHGGHQVTKGQRIVLVGFVNVNERNIRSGALAAAAKEWGRNDVRTYWNQRRLSLLKNQRQDIGGKTYLQPLWQLKNSRYLPKDTKERRLRTKEGRSYFRQNSIIPSSVLQKIENRANREKLRMRRLRAEDILLRGILLPSKERGKKIVEEEGEWLEVDLDSMDGLMLGWDGADEEDAAEM